MRGGLWRAAAFALSVAPAGAQQPERMSWKVDGSHREALVFAPTTAAPGSKAPLILAFHGHGGNMHGTANGWHFQTAWPEAIVVYLQGLPTESNRDPDGRKPGWESGPDALNAPNHDLAFVDSVLATMRRKYQVDDSRVYATGFSNGAFMTLMLWAARGSTFAAYGAVAGGIRGWQPTIPRPVIYIGGARDPLVKPDTQKVTVTKARAFDNATGAGTACGPACIYYASTSNTPVRVVTHPGGHEFPPFATAAIVAFFKNHRSK